MNDTVIRVENLSKLYRLGEISTGTLRSDFQRWWAHIRGKEDPLARIGNENDRSQKAIKGETVWALKDINFEIKQGEVLGIIGKNGAGKSTLLKILSQVTTPTTGNIKVKGRIASLLEVGTGFHPELTGRENIFLNGTILGMTNTEIRSKFDEIVDFAGVAKYIDTPVKRYSSGMYVRLAFAVAAHLEPEILIVDEVLAVGDAEFQKKALGKMKDVSKSEGRTVLFVSHNLTAIRSLCKNGIYLLNGMIYSNANIEDVINSYLRNSSLGLHSQMVETKGNNNVIIHSVKLLSSEDGTFAITEKQIINIEFTNIDIKDKLNVNLIFRNLEGMIIFATISDIKKQPIGRIKCSCEIQPNLLNDNIYIVEVLIVQNGEKPIFGICDALIIEGIEPPREISWLDKYPGYLRPQLKWDFSYE